MCHRSRDLSWRDADKRPGWVNVRGQSLSFSESAFAGWSLLLILKLCTFRKFVWILPHQCQSSIQYISLRRHPKPCSAASSDPSQSCRLNLEEAARKDFWAALTETATWRRRRRKRRHLLIAQWGNLHNYKSKRKQKKCTVHEDYNKSLAINKSVAKKIKSKIFTIKLANMIICNLNT